MIIQQTDEMKRLVNEFSEYARMPVLNKDMYDMNLLIRNVATLYTEAYKNVRFELNFDQRLQHFLFDQEQVRRVLINLIENALAAVADESEALVTIETRLDDQKQTVSLILSDTGPGIADGNYAKLFEPYYSTKKEGSGLGLAIVSKIVEDHGGLIQAYANEPQGLCFRIDLPYKTTI